MGLHLGDVTAATARAVSGCTEQEQEPLEDGSFPDVGMPPGVILNRLSGEDIVPDFCPPGRIRGSGQSWPPEARVNGATGAGRFPIAYAWALLANDPKVPWSWTLPPPASSRRESSCTPEDAIATTIAALGRRSHARGEHGEECILVIPNGLTEAAQQRLLDSPQLRGAKVRFIWRPIAAALEWIEVFRTEAIESARSRGREKKRLLALHLGMDGFEATVLQLERNAGENGPPVLPARRRPRLQAAPWLGVELFEQLAEAVSSPRPPGLGAVWRRMWASPWSGWALELIRNPETATGSLECQARRLGIESVCVRSVRHAWMELTEPLPTMRRSGLPTGGAGVLAGFTARRGIVRNDVGLMEWTEKIRRALSEERGRFAGVVITGAFASLPVRGIPFGLRVLDRLQADRPEAVLLEEQEGTHASILSRGAALYGRRLADGIPTYLDTLPRLQVLTHRAGEPQWTDLLQEDDEFVEGGKQFGPLDRDGFFIRGGEECVNLRVYFEGNPTVRNVERQFPRRAEKREPIRLRVSMEPARGNARVQIVAENPEFLKGRSVYLDWARSTDTQRTPEEMLSEHPRICPPTEPRLCSPYCWRRMRRHLDDYLEELAALRDARELERTLDRVKRGYYQRDHNERQHATAASSEGEVTGRQEKHEALLKLVAARLNARTPRVRGLALRVLAYASAREERLRVYLLRNMNRDALSGNHNAGVLACGQCLRDPADIAKFARLLHCHLVDVREQRKGGVNDWLRALSLILMYRERACESLKSSLCCALTKELLFIFERERDQGRGKFLFRYSALCIVYLLRRRAFDNDYLDPEEPLGRRAKSAFTEAHRRARARKLVLMGGRVDLSEVLKRLIDYIDRQGRGTISEGLVDQD